jgi:Ubiquitin carboxyl-terminal hydrolase, family 1.
MEQHASNACGTIAMLHAIVNLARTEPDLVAKGSFIDKFIQATKDMDPKARGEYLKGDKTLEKAHKEAVVQGDTEAEESVNTHFIAFVEVDGDLYELDGRKDFPINHGPCKPEELLAKSCQAITQFMQRDPEEIRFTIMALAQAQ